MRNKKEIRKAYQAMVKNPNLPEANHTNCYRCKTCGTVTKTIDVDPGVTPMMHRCSKCNDWAFSSFYKDTHPHLDPIQEWYRPSLKQLLKNADNEAYVEHILNGGLDYRTITKVS